MTLYPFAIFTASALFALIAWRDVRHGLFLLAASLPAYLLRFDLGSIPMTLLEAFALILVATWALTSPLTLSLKRRGEPGVPSPLERGRLGGGQWIPRGWSLPIVLILLAATVAVFVAPDRISALGIWKAYFVEPILVFLVTRDALGKLEETRNKNAEQLLLALGVGGLFVAVGAVAQYVTGLGIPAPWDVERRVTSVFPYPNAVGLYLAPIIVIGTLSLRGAAGDEAIHKRLLRFAREDIFWIVTTTASAIAIALAQSEAAIVAVVATLLVAGVLHKKTRLASVGLFAMFVLFALTTPALFDKLTFRDYSGQVRRSQWSETVAMLADRPLTGAGLNGYPAAMEPYHKDAQYEIFQYPHTLVLNVWTELGLLGLAAFAALAFQTTNIFLRSRTQGPKDPTTFLAALALLAMAIHSLADVAYFKNDLAMMTWLLLAVIASSYATSTRRV